MKRNRLGSLPLLFAILGAAGPAASADPVPAPAFDRVDHAHPDRCLDLPATAGTKARIEEIARTLPAEGFEAKVAAVGGWIGAHLRCDPNAAYAWRDFDRIVADGAYGGCADHSLVFGCLTRALGIPTVWVKTMDADWIREFRARGTCEKWRGHVFLELHDGTRWVLLDATGMILHADYDPRARLLPGNRFAYDKGADPYALVLSTRWEEWLQQTKAYFRDFDLAQLPVAEGRPVDPPGIVYIAADNPAWQLVADRCKALGHPVGCSGNTGFENWLPRARGKILVVAGVGGRFVLPPEEKAAILGREMDDLMNDQPNLHFWKLWRTLPDGTRLILVQAQDEATLEKAIADLDLDRHR